MYIHNEHYIKYFKQKVLQFSFCDLTVIKFLNIILRTLDNFLVIFCHKNFCNFIRQLYVASDFQRTSRIYYRKSRVEDKRH